MRASPCFDSLHQFAVETWHSSARDGMPAESKSWAALLQASQHLKSVPRRRKHRDQRASALDAATGMKCLRRRRPSSQSRTNNKTLPRIKQSSIRIGLAEAALSLVASIHAFACPNGFASRRRASINETFCLFSPLPCICLRKAVFPSLSPPAHGWFARKTPTLEKNPTAFRSANQKRTAKTQHAPSILVLSR